MGAEQTAAELEAMIGQARTDPGSARQILAMLTVGCHTLADFRRERQFLISLGISAQLLPDHSTPGRTDLRPMNPGSSRMTLVISQGPLQRRGLSWAEDPQQTGQTDAVPDAVVTATPGDGTWAGSGGVTMTDYDPQG